MWALIGLVSHLVTLEAFEWERFKVRVRWFGIVDWQLPSCFVHVIFGCSGHKLILEWSIVWLRFLF